MFRRFLLVSTLLSGLAFGGPILYTESAVSYWNSDDSPFGPLVCYDSSSCVGSTNLAGSLLTYSGMSSADYGVLKASGSLSIDRAFDADDPGDGPNYVSQQSVASFQDQWTITGGTPGEIGHLILRFHITGNYDYPIGTGVAYGLSLYNATSNTYSSDNQLPPYTGELTTSFIFGTAFDFRVSLVAGAQLYNMENGGFDGQASFMNMANTATLETIIVIDQTETQVPFSLRTASESRLFDSLSTPGAVPEPGTLVLGFVGLLGVVAAKRASNERSTAV